MRTKHIVIGFGVIEALSEVLRGVIAYAKNNDRRWRLRCVNESEFPQMLTQRPADGGLAFITAANTRMIASIAGTGIPVVNMVHDCHPALSSVLADELATGRAAAEYLMGRGHQHFAYLGFNSDWSRARGKGFVDALAKAGKSCHLNPTFEATDNFRFLDVPGSAEALLKWTASLPKPIGMLVCSDPIAGAALEIWTAAGIEIPQDMAVIGVGNLIATCELSPVPLSSVAVDFPGMGYHAARMLDGLMRGEAKPSVPTFLAPPGVVTRRSTDEFMFDDEHVRAAMRIIHDRAADGLDMKELVKCLPVSRRWLDTQFKAVVGHTPSIEIRKLRLARIRELLLSTDLTVQQIATLCGFSRPENLIRFFRDAYGSPPSAYRLKYGTASPSTQTQHRRA